MAAAPTLDTLDIHSADRYAAHGYPWAEWDLLRREAPVFRYEREDIAPFWAITRHEDVLALSRHSKIFVNSGPILRLTTIEEDRATKAMSRVRAERDGWDPDEPHDFIFMDDPRHRDFRLLSARAFTPAALRRKEAHFAEISARFAQEFRERIVRDTAAGRSTDFVTHFAVKLPLAAICEMMGFAEGDWERLLYWTGAMFAPEETGYRRPGESRFDATTRAVDELRDYLMQQVEGRRARGLGKDLTDAVVGGEIDGLPLTDQQIQGYLTVLIAAGNETTRNATTGGLMALLEHPLQRDLLCENPDLLEPAVEEILRWTSPVIQFARTAVADFELRGTRIRAGDTVGLFYPSANRDEAVFDEPYRFDITRDPNRHLAFGGYGAHFCLGANLARWEMRASLRALLPLLPELELVGDPLRVAHLHVGGIQQLSVRHAPTAAAQTAA